MRPALVLLVLLAPLASAAEAAPVEGQLRFPAGARLDGAVALDAGMAILDLAPAASANGTILSWSVASGHVVEKVRTELRASVGAASVRPDDARVEPVRFSEGTLGGLACRPGCVLALFTEGVEGASLGVEGDVDATLTWLREPRVFLAGFPNQSESFVRVADASWTQLPATDAKAGPRVGLFLWNVTGEVRTAEGATRVDTGVFRRPMGHDALAEEVTTRFMVLELEAPRILARISGATLYAAEPGLRLDGVLSGRAQGALEVDGRRVEVERSVRLEGRLLLLPRGDAETLPRLDVPDPLSKGGTTLLVSGEAERVQVDGRTVTAPASTAARAGVGALALLLLVAVALWSAKPLLFTPFYTRVDPARLLENPTRARLCALVAASPGLTAADLVRGTGHARVVVEHHLRALVAHGYLTARRGRRRIAYFPVDQAPDAVQHARADVLADATRRGIARLLLEERGWTQKEIALREDLRERLVSYHLGRLESAGLARAEGGMPRAWGGTDALREALAEKERRVRVPVLDADATAAVTPPPHASGE